MTIIEAAKSGFRFRRKGWDNWITSNENQYGYLTAHLTSYDILAEDWEIDAPKKRYWKWVVKGKGGHLGITENFYDDDGYLYDGDKSGFEFIQKIESEFIEV